MKQSSPAAARNRDPITDILRTRLPDRGLVLEIASGSGEHVLHLARTFPKLLWQPTDAEPAAIRSIEAWRSEAGLFNLLPAVALDVRAAAWPIAEADAILCINMVHISPWAATCGLMRGAGRLLGAGSLLYLYGPFHQDGVETAASNLAFDSDLRARNAQWGLRSVQAVADEAAVEGFGLAEILPMPANNLSLVFRKS